MFKKTHILTNGKKLDIIRCMESEIPYIKSRKNIMDKEVQKLAHMGTYQTTKVYLFKRLMSEDATESAHMKAAYINIPAERILSSHKDFFLLAVIDDEIAGYINSMGLWRDNEDFPARKNLFLWDVEVIRKYRKLGIATLLFESLKECGAENGYEYIYSDSNTNSSWINEDNSAGISLFLKTGAVELNNVDAMQAVLLGEENENPYDAMELDEDDNMYDNEVHEEIKSYKWEI